MEESFEIIKGRLEAKGIKFIRLLWCDTANVIRAKAFHINTLSKEGPNSIGLTPAGQGFAVMADAVVPASGLQPVGEVFLRPDWSTLVFPPYADGHACVMSHIIDHGHPWELDGRVLLQKMVAKLQSHYGIKLKVAFENEFYLLDAMGEEITITDDTLYASADALNIHHQFINDFSKNLLAQNIAVQNVHAESGPGQLEVSIGHRDPVTAADQQILFRETARAIARQHNHIASFLPKIFADATGSGAHIHFSLWEEDLNITGADNLSGLSQTAEYFVSGLLLHLRSLMALTTPTPNSYRRILPKTWSGAYAVWGRDNREAAIRVPTTDGAQFSVNIEYKTSDASANPYIALAGLIIAGFEGIKEKYPLGPELKVDPSTLGPDKMEDIVALNTDLWSALEDFRHDDIFKSAMGEELFKVYMAVKHAEYEGLKGLTLDDEVKLLLERY
jgi:glutamine synthetase